MLTCLDLFSGIGGFSLGLERTGGFRTIAFCEIDPFCRAILAKHWPGVPCYEDVRELNPPDVDVITAGFPCQDVSNAGKRAGISAARSGLYGEALRCLRVVSRAVGVLENVAALLCRGMGTVLGDLAEIGRDAEWDCISACVCGAPHARDRVFIVAHPNGERRGPARFLPKRLNEMDSRSDHWETAPRGEWRNVERWFKQTIQVGNGFVHASDNLRIPDGIPRRMDRLKALGNSVVPQVAEVIGRAILAGHSTTTIRSDA